MTEQQAHASASTFSKRYVFQNGFGILTGDEDNDAQDPGNNITTPQSGPPKETSEQKYNKLEQEILALIDKKNISEEARKKAIDYINATYPDGRKVIHGIKNLEQLKRHIIELPEELVTPEDESKLNDDDVVSIFGGEVVDNDEPVREGNLSE